jgi:hypothetical protein
VAIRRLRIAIADEVEMTQSRDINDQSRGLLGEMERFTYVKRLVAVIADPNAFPSVWFILKPGPKYQACMRHVGLIHAVWVNNPLDRA